MYKSLSTVFTKGKGYKGKTKGKIDTDCTPASAPENGTTGGLPSPLPPILYNLGNMVLSAHRIAGLVVKTSASGAEDPGFDSRLRRDFSGLSHTGDLKIGTPVATLPGAWHYKVSYDWSAWCQYTVAG